MKKKFKQNGMALCVVLILSTGFAAAQQMEAPSTVNAKYVEESATRPLQAGEKISNLFTRNAKQEFVLQRVTPRIYWYQSQYYGTIFYVGDKGVLLFDAPEHRADLIKKSIASVTKLPITAIVYSHAHADHIGDAKVFVDEAKKSGVKLRVIASKATNDILNFMNSSLPRPNEILTWPNSSFKFEGLDISLYGFKHAAHTSDHAVWLLGKERVAHVPDLVNPDQLPYWSFAGAEVVANYERNLTELGKLDWTFLSGGHGNIGDKADITFYQTFIGDMKQAIGRSMGEVPWGAGVDHPEKLNAHTAYLPAWLGAVANKATEYLRPKYGQYYGFDVATPRNAELMSIVMYAYR